MSEKAIQDYYPDQLSYCYGCGRLNEYGHQIKSYWQGEEMVCHFTPKPYHTAIPGYVYGGLIASLIDCHSTGSASAAYARFKEIDIEVESAPRFVTASLKVDYLRPTPPGSTAGIARPNYRTQRAKSRCPNIAFSKWRSLCKR